MHAKIALDKLNRASIHAHEGIVVNGRILEKGEMVQLRNDDVIAICGHEFIYKEAQSTPPQKTDRKDVNCSDPIAPPKEPDENARSKRIVISNETMGSPENTRSIENETSTKPMRSVAAQTIELVSNSTQTENPNKKRKKNHDSQFKLKSSKHESSSDTSSSSSSRDSENSGRSDSELQCVMKTEMLTIWNTLSCFFVPAKYLGAGQIAKTNHVPQGRQLCAHFWFIDGLSMHSIHTRIMEGHYSSTRHCLDDLRALFLLGKEHPTWSLMHKDGQVLLDAVDKFIKENEKQTELQKIKLEKLKLERPKLDKFTIPLPTISRNSATTTTSDKQKSFDKNPKNIQ